MAVTNRGGVLAVTVLCSVQFVDVLGVTVVVTALPRMLADLNASASDGSLISGGYAMFFGGLLMLGARLGRPVRPPAHHHRQPGRARRRGAAGRGRRLGRAADSGPLPARSGSGRIGALGAAAADYPHP